MTASLRGEGVPTFPGLVERLADEHGSATALIGEKDSWSYRALARQMNRYAHWARAQAVAPGDVVALLVPGGPDYLALWLGLTRMGAVVALVNTNLTGEALMRALATVQAKFVIAAVEFARELGAERRDLPDGLYFCRWEHTDKRFTGVDDDLAAQSDEPIEDYSPALADRALYLYTSGTEGFPKAATVTHRRIMEWTHWFAGLLDMTPSDRMYDCLPMYHAIGGIIGPGATLVGGGAAVLRPRFAASMFWRDIAANRCTIFLYIGELCRYLLNQPPDPDEARHELRLCCGSGLRKEIWEQFETRFRIPQILEFYAATEGAVSLYNCEGKPGAIGRVPPFLAHRNAVALIEVDVDSGEVVRGADGLCRRCVVNEPGEAIGQIATSGAGQFDGYTDPAASRAKFLRNVFVAGDRWYRTGDLLRQDEEGFFQFIDRLGDSYRWKGENIAASDVAAAVAACPGVNEVIAYGVRVPGTDGRAGMAVIVPGLGFDLVALCREIRTRLPSYAQPLFLRIAAAIPKTATFRPQKQGFLRAGFDPASIADPLYFNDRSQPGFLTLDAALYRRIAAGEIRL